MLMTVTWQALGYCGYGAGLDTCLAIMRVLHEGLGDSKYRPCPLLVQYVDAGKVAVPNCDFSSALTLVWPD